MAPNSLQVSTDRLLPSRQLLTK